MKTLFDACMPRPDLISGHFNPEIFTASLKQVIDHYQAGRDNPASVYTDPEAFFREATFATDGLKRLLGEVFGRLAGDPTFPAIHRLETAFGGGKTHSLIACTHLAMRGRELASATEGLLDPGVLPAPGEIAVVGVPGDSLSVHSTKGRKLQRHTLWGEIAWQVGGENLYKEVEADAGSQAAPGRNYFEAVLGGRKALIMLDELAQYASRLEAARSGGAEQLAAFLMALHGHARDHAGISVIVTLASQADAFSGQTERLQSLLSDITGASVGADEALDLAERAGKSLGSVIARDATTVVPVHASEISRVLAKRLFVSIDQDQARSAAAEYAALYRRSEGQLPEQAGQPDFVERMVSHYPFHPTFIDFLAAKLSQVENFQGTRGVLRVLCLAVRNLWKKKPAIPMVHTCHLDMRDARIVEEITGRTGSADLLAVLNADVGGVDTGMIEGGASNAQAADRRNPHPEGYPMVEWTWKTIFLHSLVGRDEGLASNVFGLSETDALFQVAFPGLTPPQILTALKEIEQSAYYLRFREGRYFASLEPSINIALAKIRKALKFAEITDLLHATTRKVVRSEDRTFEVHTGIAAPDELPDNKDRPQLGLVSLDAGEVDPEAFVTTRGSGTPRVMQNLVFLLVPQTVLVRENDAPELPSMSEAEHRAAQSLHRMQDLARWVLAMRKLKEKPSAHGIQPAKLAESDFDQRHREREQALVTAVAESFASLWFPSASGRLVRKEIKGAGAEGGQDLMNAIREVLLKERELVTSAHITQADLLNLGKLFFHHADHISLAELRRHFCERRTWPVLESRDVLEKIARAGAENGQWCVFRMGEAEDDRPAEIYTRDLDDVPLGLDLREKDWSLVTISGARKRGWMEEVAAIDKTKLRGAIEESLRGNEPVSIGDMREQVAARVGDVPDEAFAETLEDLLRRRQAVTYSAAKKTDKKPPKIVTGGEAIMLGLDEKNLVLSRAEASKRGWLDPDEGGFRLDSKEGGKRLLPILAKIGGLYRKGALSPIDLLDAGDLDLPEGGRLRLVLTDATPATLKRLDEFFEVLADQVSPGADSWAELQISEPADGCKLIEALAPKEDA